MIGITRYSLEADIAGEPDLVPSLDGEWVRYDDVLAHVEQEHDIRSDRETLLQIVARRLDVPDEPHQTWEERLIAALPERRGRGAAGDEK